MIYMFNKNPGIVKTPGGTREAVSAGDSATC